MATLGERLNPVPRPHAGWGVRCGGDGARAHDDDRGAVVDDDDRSGPGYDDDDRSVDELDDFARFVDDFLAGDNDHDERARAGLWR